MESSAILTRMPRGLPRGGFTVAASSHLHSFLPEDSPAFSFFYLPVLSVFILFG